MRQEVFQCDSAAEGAASAVIAKIGADVLIESELPRLDKLHDGRCRKRLRDRSDSERSRFDIDRRASSGISESVSAREYHLTVTHDGDGDPRGAVPIEFFLDKRVEEGLEVARGQTGP